jgi:transcriptional regulator with XRE-family HTH domain
MTRIVAYYATIVNEKVSYGLNDANRRVSYDPSMGKVAEIHGSKTPVRIHYLQEWLDHRHMSKADLVRAMDINKSSVSKWCTGDLPSEKNLLIIAAALEIEPEALFRHPLDDWMTKFFKQRSEDELKRMVETLKAAFPQKSGTHG